MKPLAKFIVLVIGIVIINVVRSSDSDFQSFSVKQGKTYATQAEANLRKAIFEKNLKKIADLNAQSKKNNENVVHGTNQFTDYESSEFIKKFTGLKLGSSLAKAIQIDASNSSHLVSAVTNFGE